MEKVTCIGRAFIKANDVKFINSRYQKHLGIEFGYNSYVINDKYCI